jgi:Asp-tRNA(Asn)/Glu-tRNA(Gln) amidotransferase C subunit
MTANAVTPGAADVQTLARLAGLTVANDIAGTIAERLGALLGQLGAVSDEDLENIEPAFVLPLKKA